MEQDAETVHDKIDMRARIDEGAGALAVKKAITGSVITPGPRGNIVDRLRENPLVLVLGAAAVGFAIGSFLPATPIENERLGPIGNRLKEQAKERARESLKGACDAAAQAITKAMAST